MTAIGAAIERRRWEVVALYLLLGVTAAAAKLPSESLEALVELLAGEPAPGPDGGRR